MTNFKKWKEGLTAIEAAHVFYNTRTCTLKEPCGLCPARKLCDKIHNGDVSKRAFNSGESCWSAFCVWATAEAEEEETK